MLASVPSNDNLTSGLGDLYRQGKRKPRPGRIAKAPTQRRPRSGRAMALDPFFVLTVVLLACALLLQFFLMFWLEFF